MSYILDALRKADAERERGNVPGIHAQPMFAGAPQSAQRASSRPWVFVLAGAAVVLLAVIAVLVWMLAGSGNGAPVNVASSGSVTAAPAGTAAMSAGTGTASTASASTSAPSTAPASVVANAAVPAPAVAPQAAAARTVPSAGATGASAATATAPATATATQKVAREPAAVARKPKPATAAGSAPLASANGASASPSPAASTEARIYTITELPDEIRRSLPSIVVGGSVYSSVPANRFLFINGQVMHEGDVVSPGVVLQLIRLKAAVLLYKGYRYEMNY